jgi:Protein of unknown function (DUF1583)
VNGGAYQTQALSEPDKSRLTVLLHQDFRNEEFDSRAIVRVGGYADEFVRPDREGLRIRIPVGLKNPEAVGVAPRCRIRGDFELTVSFKIVKAEQPIRGYGVAATVWAETDTVTRDAVTIERGIVPKEGERFTSTQVTGRPEARKYDVRRAPAKTRYAKLRMARVGSKVTTSFADGEQPFRELRTVLAGAKDIVFVRIGADTGVSDHGVEILLEELTIRAEALPGLRVPARPPGEAPKAARARP